MKQRMYIAIDLKSFYASVECVERGLDPLTANLVVADKTRTEKTICLAVSPSLKSYGIPGRPRLFEVVQKVREINAQRRRNAPYRRFRDSSYDNELLKKDPSLELDYVVAAPRMAHYISTSAKIYDIYLKYIAPEDIHVYSIDEVFMDVTDYLNTYHMNAEELARAMIHDVLKETGITATAGIGTNLFLAKVAMDIVAKHKEADENGVRIASLDEMEFRRQLWDHRPLTDFWRIGRGYRAKLEANQLFTMGDIARCSLENEELLYKLFGINAELLIDHAWGYESCTMEAIKAYRPSHSSLSSGQVLMRPYDYEEALLVVKEMSDQLALDLSAKHLVTRSLILLIGFDSSTKLDESDEVGLDYYGRPIAKHAHGAVNFKVATASSKELRKAAEAIYRRTVKPKMKIRRVNVTAGEVVDKAMAETEEHNEQISLFADVKKDLQEEKQAKRDRLKEDQLQQAVLEIKKRYGKNAVVKGMSLDDSATARTRNKQIGGHKA